MATKAKSNSPRARKARKKMRAENVVNACFRDGGFETIYPNKRQSNRFIVKAAGRDIMVVPSVFVNEPLVESWLKRPMGAADELWFFSWDSVESELYEHRERYLPHVKIMNVGELAAAIYGLQQAGQPKTPPKRGATATRTRVGKALLVNADELGTAVRLHCY